MKKILIMLCIFVFQGCIKPQNLELRLDKGKNVDVWTYCYKNSISNGFTTYHGKKNAGWVQRESDLKRGYTYMIVCSGLNKETVVSIYFNQQQQGVDQTKVTFKYK